MIKQVIIVIILASSIPVGYILAYLCRDELVSGRKWFKFISLVLAISIILLLIFYRNSVLILSLIYMGIVSLISYLKSYDKKFVKWDIYSKIRIFILSEILVLIMGLVEKVSSLKRKALSFFRKPEEERRVVCDNCGDDVTDTGGYVSSGKIYCSKEKCRAMVRGVTQFYDSRGIQSAIRRGELKQPE